MIQNLETCIASRPYVVAIDSSSVPPHGRLCAAMRAITDTIDRTPLELVAVGVTTTSLIDAPSRNDLINLNFSIEVSGGSLVGSLGEYLTTRGYGLDTAIVLISDGYCVVDHNLPFELILVCVDGPQKDSPVLQQFTKVFTMEKAA